MYLKWEYILGDIRCILYIPVGSPICAQSGTRERFVSLGPRRIAMSVLGVLGDICVFIATVSSIKGWGGGQLVPRNMVIPCIHAGFRRVGGLKGLQGLLCGLGLFTLTRRHQESGALWSALPSLATLRMTA